MATVSLLVHGAGSSPDTARRLLRPAVPPGSHVVALDARASVDHIVADLDRTARRAASQGASIALAAGISLGAHAVAMWAAAGGTADAVLLVMPAWTGAPAQVATMTSAAADEVAALGIHAVLSRLRADPALADDWVLDELARGWSTYADTDLVAALRAAAASRAPDLETLGRITTPTAVVSLRDDPLHPEAVALTWHRAITHSTLEVVPRNGPADDREALGKAGSRALSRLSGSR